MHMRLFGAFAIPSESAPRKVNLNLVVLEQGLPQNRHLLALRNAVRGNERGFCVSAFHQLRRFFVPA